MCISLRLYIKTLLEVAFCGVFGVVLSFVAVVRCTPPLPRLPFFVRYAAFSVIFFFFILPSCYLYPICYVVLHCLYCWYCLLRIYVCSYSTILVSWYCDIVLLLLCCVASLFFFLCGFLFLCYNLIFIFILDKINIIIRVIIYTMHDKYYIYYYDKNLC